MGELWMLRVVDIVAATAGVAVEPCRCNAMCGELDL
jgi:hypothetical protein